MMSSSSAGQSNVGFPSLYESQNQKNLKKSEAKELRQHTGENVEGFLPKDQPGEINRLHEQEIQKKREEKIKTDPTFLATLHGNQPNKGAVIDKELQEEDEAMLRKKKGDSLPGKK